MHRYKKELLGAIDKMVKDVRASKAFYNAVCDELEEEAFFSGIGGKDSVEAKQGVEGVRIASTMISLLEELRERFDLLT
jgi:hypothetical protein